MPVVFCKPDALHGPNSVIDCSRARAMIAALAAFCDGKPLGVEPQWREAVARAEAQITERARTEVAFRGSLVRPAGVTGTTGGSA